MTPNREHRWRWELGIVVLVSLPFVFFGIGSIGFLDPDEGMYGSIAREMVEKGDWVTPHFNSVRYLEKPPLQFWLSALTIAVFGLSEWAVRIWSALPMLGTAILVWLLGRMLYGGRAGLFSAIVMISSVGVFRYVRVAATDSLLVFSLTLSLYGFIRAMLSDERGEEFGQEEKVDRPQGSEPTNFFLGFQLPLILFYLGMSLALLSKGLIGVVFPVFIVGLFLLLSGEPSHGDGRWSISGRISNIFKSVWSPIGFFIFFVLTLPWHLLAAWSNKGFIQFYLLDNQFLRFLNSRSFIEDDVPVGTFVFLIMLLVWFFPWSIFIPGAIKEGFPGSRTRNESPTANLRSIVGIWFVTILAFFSLSGSKLEHYFLPLIPPLSLMVGSLWSKALSSSDNDHLCVESAPIRRRMMWCLGSGTLCCFSIGLGLIIYSAYLTPESVMNGLAELNVYYRILQAKGIALPFASISPFIFLVKSLGLALFVGTLLSFSLFYLRLPKASFLSVLCLAGVIGALVVKLLFFIETHHSAKFVAEAIGSQLGSGDVIIHEGSLEYSAGLPFYTGQKIFVLNGKGGDLDFGSGYPESRHLFLDDRKFIRLWEGGQRVFLVTRSEVQDSILNRFSNHKLFLVGRFGTRWLYSNEAAVNETIEGAQVAGVVGPGVRSVVEPWIDDRISRLGFNPLRV